MLSQLVLAEVGNSMLGNMIIVSGAIVLLLVLLKIFAWDAVVSMMNKREDKIANDLDSAEQSRMKAAKLEEERQSQLNNARNEAADILKSAKDSGELSRQNILNETKEEADRLKEKAKADISMEKETALNEVKEDVAQLSLQIAEKILGRELTPENHESLINQYIEELGNQHEAR